MLAQEHDLGLLMLPLKALHLLDQVDLSVYPVFRILNFTYSVHILIEVLVRDAKQPLTLYLFQVLKLLHQKLGAW